MIRTSTARNRMAAVLVAVAAATLAATAQAAAESPVQRDTVAEAVPVVTPVAVAPISGIVLGDPGVPVSYRAVMSCVVLESGSGTGSTGLCGPRPATGSDIGQAGIIRGDRPEQLPTEEGQAIVPAAERVVTGA